MCSPEDMAITKALMETIILVEEDQDIIPSLTIFVQKASTVYAFDVLNNREIIGKLWGTLFHRINGNNPEVRLLCLEALSILTLHNSDFEIFLTSDRMKIIVNYANIFSGPDEDTTFEPCVALKILVTIIHKNPNVVALIMDPNTIEQIRIKDGQSDSYLMSELKSYDMKVASLLSDILQDVLMKVATIEHLIPKLEYLMQAANQALKTPEVAVICEVLKILDNASLDIKPSEKVHVSSITLVNLLRRLLCIPVLNDIMKVKLHGHIVAVLEHLSHDTYIALQIALQENEDLPDIYKYENHNLQAIFHLVEYLKSILPNLKKTNTKDLIIILTILQRTASTSRIMRKFICSTMFPKIRNDLSAELSAGYTLRDQLFSLLCSSTMEVTNLISNLIFHLCKENVDCLLKRLGYSNTAALLIRRGLLAQIVARCPYNSDDNSIEPCKSGIIKEEPSGNDLLFTPLQPSVSANFTNEQKEKQLMQVIQIMDSFTDKGVAKPLVVLEKHNTAPQPQALV